MRPSGQAPGSETDEARGRNVAREREKETVERVAMEGALVAGVRRV